MSESTTTRIRVKGNVWNRMSDRVYHRASRGVWRLAWNSFWGVGRDDNIWPEVGRGLEQTIGQEIADE